MTPLEQAAVAYVTARRAALDLLRQRNETRCEHEVFDEHDYVTGYTPPRTDAPCWRAEGSAGEMDALRPEFWCAPCRERQRLHEQLPSARAKTSGALRRLERIAGKAAP